MEAKGILVNSAPNWNEKRRYKINAIVIYNGTIYQNGTGINSEPGVGDDWVLIKKAEPLSLIVPFGQSIIFKNEIDTDNSILEVGNRVIRVVDGFWIRGIYTGGDPLLLTSYEILDQF